MYILPLVVLFSAATAKFPSNFNKCNRKDANFNDCVKDAAIDGIRQLTRAYPELKVPNAEPLEVVELNIAPGAKGVVAVSQKFQNCKIFGITKAHISNFEIEFDKKKFQLNAFIPDIKLKCDYELDGKILILPIVGKGPAEIRITNCSIILQVIYEESKRADGQTTIRGVNDTLALTPGKLEFHFKNLFDGDKALGDNLNRVLNENWQSVWEDIKNEYQKVFGMLFLELVSDFFATISLEEAVD